MIFPQLFCKHKWKTHFKGKFQEEKMIMHPIGSASSTGITHDFTKEVLICEKCGKIKKIEY